MAEAGAVPAPVAGGAAPAAEPKQVEPPKVETSEDLQKRLAYLEGESKSRGQEAQSLRKRIRELEAEKKAGEEKALAEKGQFKELAETRARDLEQTRQELEQARGKLSSFEQREAEEQQKRAAQVEADFAALPEAVRAHVPADADLRLKELTINTARAMSGTKPQHPPPPATAPRPASGPAQEPPRVTDAEMQEFGNPNTPQPRKAEIGAKLAARRDWDANRQ